MKSADLRPDTTYVGRRGDRRHVLRIVTGELHERDHVLYDLPEGGVERRSITAFARWAKREALPEEAAPPTVDSHG